ncbi:MAG: carboxymuconolactone decarboxylase family protein [Deltaproteobacteria bacterium]|nr:carboxymuconolactone decarboxylase family protein [Deltaproteobacteria bacterium]
MNKQNDNKNPPPPRTFTQFAERFPKLEEAWSLLGEAGGEGPLDAKTVRLIKLAVSMGNMSSGQVRSGVRKSLALGIAREEIEQVVAIAAGSVGLPSTAALYSWVKSVLDRPDGPRDGCC